MVYNIVMTNIQIENVFTIEEINDIQAIIDQELATREILNWNDAKNGNWHESKVIRIKENLGRLDINEVPLPQHIIDKIIKLVKEDYKTDLEIETLIGITYAEYSLKYGKPRLDVHKDRDPADAPQKLVPGGAGIVLTYQLDSNVSWQVGTNKELYTIPNNGILLFYPRRDYHWRTLREWSDGDFVKILFFEMLTPKSPEVHDDEVLAQEIRDFRRNLEIKL